MNDTHQIEENQLAPDFTLSVVGEDQAIKDGQLRLSDLRGRTVILYFYPKDDTPGCTKEACDFRDANHRMQTKYLHSRMPGSRGS